MTTLGTYIKVYLALIALTGLTVTAAGLHLGSLSVLAAILIATVKSSLVLSFFMNLKSEDRVFKVMLAVAVATMAVIMLLTFVDVGYR